ncbi:helix-turn-helix domain-containing protein [Halomarina oriensis]|uniref:Helix-turn-helix domain-containing protein n=1 Tax=Halomarina oriensis TaxID=671145 RepID=A0A6B0GW53_9EURY|nr:helix-turn-helix domain-containing protein [Halomarina oriensis]MWG36375.1 helix-turn-helix domain-containing protein [Halomarina oriensis]
MPDSMSDYLQQDMECEGLLECFHGLKELDRTVFGVLVAADGPLTVDEVAERVDRERTTAYRATQRLLDAGFLRKEQVNYENGGYYHVFEPLAADEVADDMQRLLNDWYAKMGQLIQEFRTKYDDPEPSAVSAER